MALIKDFLYNLSIENYISDLLNFIFINKEPIPFDERFFKSLSELIIEGREQYRDHFIFIEIDGAVPYVYPNREPHMNFMSMFEHVVQASIGRAASAQHRSADKTRKKVRSIFGEALTDITFFKQIKP